MEDLTLRSQREKMTKERKMGVVNSAWGDFMAACNLLMRERAQRRKGGRRGREEKSCRNRDENENREERFGSANPHRQISSLPVLARQPQRICQGKRAN